MPKIQRVSLGSKLYNVQFQDSLLSSEAYIIPRYRGSKLRCKTLNSYTTGSYKISKPLISPGGVFELPTKFGGSILINEAIVYTTQDISFGGDPVIDYLDSNIYEFVTGSYSMPQFHNITGSHKINVFSPELNGVVDLKLNNTITIDSERPDGDAFTLSSGKQPIDFLYTLRRNIREGDKVDIHQYNDGDSNVPPALGVEDGIEVLFSAYRPFSQSLYMIPSDYHDNGTGWLGTNDFPLTLASGSLCTLANLNAPIPTVDLDRGYYITGSLVSSSVVFSSIANGLNKNERWFLTVFEQPTNSNPRFPYLLSGSGLFLHTTPQTPLTQRGVFEIDRVEGTKTFYLTTPLDKDLDVGRGGAGGNVRRYGVLFWKAIKNINNATKNNIILGLDEPRSISPGALTKEFVIEALNTKRKVKDLSKKFGNND